MLRHHSWIGDDVRFHRTKDLIIMAQSSPLTSSSPKSDPRAVEILAKNIYREFRASGFSERDVLALAGELLALVTRDVKAETPL